MKLLSLTSLIFYIIFFNINVIQYQLFIVERVILEIRMGEKELSHRPLKIDLFVSVEIPMLQIYYRTLRI